MDSEPLASKATSVLAANHPQRPGRTWTERLEHPVKYRRYTANNAAGFPFIFLKFDFPPGQSTLHPEVFSVLQEMTTLDGRTATGLKLVRDKIHGKVWRLPDSEIGRTAADVIDGKLRDIADRTRGRANSR